MYYNVYKNISDEQFIELKQKLGVLRSELIRNFKESLKQQKRFDDEDYLALNFEIIDINDWLEGNLSLLFEDKPEKITFEVGIIKVIDIEGYRYFKRVAIIQGMTIDYIKDNLIEIITKALNLYYAWTKEDVINAEKVKLSQR